MANDNVKVSNARGDGLSGAAVFGALAALVLISYAGMFRADFVYDDHSQLVGNASIRDLRNIPLFFTDPANTIAGMYFEGIYRPLRTTCFALEYRLWGLNPAAYHAANIVFHLFNSFFVFLFIRRLIGAQAPALVAAALFAAHPALTDDVCWICSRSDLLCMFFYLGALLAYYRSREEDALRRAAFLAVALFALALAMLSKEMAVTFPADLKGQTLKRWLSYAPFIAITAVYLLVRISIMSRFAQRSQWGATPLASAGIVAKAMAFYVGILVYPFRLTLLPVVDTNVSLSDKAAVFAVALVIGLIAFAVAFRRKYPMATLGVVLFFILLLPVSNIIPVTTVVAGRFVYIPSLGFFLAVAALANSFKAPKNQASSRQETLLAGAVCAIVFLFSLNTVARSLDWRTDLSIFKSAVEVAPDNPRARTALGKEYFLRNDFEAARRQAEAALEHDPSYPEAHRLLGRMHLEEGRIEEAEKKFKLALEVAPYDNIANNALGTIYRERGMLDEALALFKKSTERSPIIWETLNNAGSVLLEKGELSAALEYFDRASKEKPDSPEAAYNMAISLLGLSRHAEAARFVEGWMSKYPGGEQMLTPLGLAYTGEGNYEAAVRAYRRALAANPADTRALGYLADLLMGAGEYEEAASLYESLLERRPSSVGTQVMLGAALQRIGRLDEAVEHLRAAVRLKPDDAALQKMLTDLLEKAGE